MIGRVSCLYSLCIFGMVDIVLSVDSFDPLTDVRSNLTGRKLLGFGYKVFQSLPIAIHYLNVRACAVYHCYYVGISKLKVTYLLHALSGFGPIFLAPACL